MSDESSASAPAEARMPPPEATLTAATRVPLEYRPVPREQRMEGDPSTGGLELDPFAGAELGVWEMTPGTMRDVEADEIFVVLSGAATVEFDDSGQRLELAPGDVVRLHEGQRTVWTVTETLRKVYLSS